MSENLITAGFINPFQFPLPQVLAEAATVLNISPERISEVQCWQHQLWVNIKGVGGKFMSYRRLPIWFHAALKAIQQCTSLESLQDIGAILRMETHAYHKYYDAEIIQQLRQVWANQSEVLKAQEAELSPLKAHQEAAYQWQQSWIHIIRYCRDIQALQRLVKEIQHQSEEFFDVPGILPPIEEYWAQRWHEIMTVS